MTEPATSHLQSVRLTTPAPVLPPDGDRQDRRSYAYWNVHNQYSEAVLMTPAQIEAYNRENLDRAADLRDLATLPAVIPGSQIRAAIRQLGEVSDSRYTAAGKLMTDGEIAGFLDLGELNRVADQVTVRYATAVRRTVLRTFPTAEPAYGSVQAAAVKGSDYFMETAVYPWEEVAIFHLSRDGAWVFAAIWNYQGWIPLADLALTSRDDLMHYTRSPDFITMIAAKTQFAGVQLDMGVRLPRDPVDSSRILLPVRQSDGTLAVRAEAYPPAGSWWPGRLPYSKANLIRQALKFQGEAYGWGGMNGTRDCSGFVLDVHRSFGLLLPRNTDEQEKTPLGGTTIFTGQSSSEKLQTLIKLAPGSVLYMRGHAMLYLGLDYDQTPWMVHQFGSYLEQGQRVSVQANQMTPATIGFDQSTTFLDQVTLAREFLR